MWGTFLKRNVICFTLTGLLLAALLAISFLAERQGYRNLLMASPLGAGSPRLSVERLEDFAKEEFLLTYEIRKSAVARAANQSHSVNLVGTNSHYAALLGYLSLDGSFFAATAMDAKQRHIVLNETAAFQIFGSTHIAGQTLKLDGESWIITGVIQDGDADHSNLYVPASVTGGQAGSVIALLDDTVTEAYARNALKSIGIHESNCEFFNLARSVGIFGECVSVAWKSALFLLLLFFAFRTGSDLSARLRFDRAKLEDLYFREMLAQYRPDVLRTAGSMLFLIMGVVIMLFLSLQILETCLTWRSLPLITGELTAGDFGRRLVWLRDMQPISFILFAAYIAGIILNLLWTNDS